MPGFLNRLCCSVLLVAVGLVGCQPIAPLQEPEAPSLRRLTESQYRNSIQDLLGDEIFIPSGIEPDLRVEGLLAVGASRTAVSPRGVENFEAAAYVLAEQALSPELREQVVSCAPAGIVDADCAQRFVEEMGRRTWRRNLTDQEVATLVEVAGQGADVLGDFWDGLEFALAALLQAPDFLYRIELGEPDPTGAFDRRFTDWELASRLSFLLWNTTPDDALLDAAEAGELTTEAGLSASLNRLLADSRARAGLGTWFADLMHLADLDSLYKDSATFLHMSDTLGASARQETLLGFEHLAFDEDGDLRDIVTTRRAWLNRELAALYDVRSPAREGFGEHYFDTSAPRVGLLGQVSFLALHSHPSSSSPTLRGKFVREVLLCHELPGALAGVDTSIPEPSEEARTLRERVASHLDSPACGPCHRPMDLVGLAFENFDGLGRYRSQDNGVDIDASGELDGGIFDDAEGLAWELRGHPDFPDCLAGSLASAGTGLSLSEGQHDIHDWLAGDFAASGYRLKALARTLVTSPIFLEAGALDPVGYEPPPEDPGGSGEGGPGSGSAGEAGP